MSIITEERPSDSPYVDLITRGRTMSDGSPIRPAEIHWHMVFVRHNGHVLPFVVGPWTTAGVVSYTEGAEVLWVRFKLGAFMPHLPTRRFLNTETLLPGASSRRFWLYGSAWHFPDYNNVETFVDRLVRDEVLMRDPLVDDALHNHVAEMSPRTVRHHFLQATGQSRNHVYQFERAQRAAALLQQGASILDTVEETGYYDQPHLTRSLRRFVGFTPAQIAGRNESAG